MKQSFLILIVSSVLILPSFSQISVEEVSLSPNQSPAVSKSLGAAGTTDSLEIAEKYLTLKHFQQALKITLRELDKALSSKDQNRIFKANLLVAKIFTRSNNYEKALEYQKRNLLLISNSNNQNTKAILNLDIGTTFFEMRELDSSEIYLTKVVIEKTNNSEIEKLKARAYSNLSNINIEKGLLNLAAVNAKKALAIQYTYNDHYSTAYTLNSLGSIYMTQKNYKDAEMVFLEAIELLDLVPKETSLNLKEILYDNLSFVLYKLKDYNAYYYQEQSYNIRDSIRDTEISGILAEVEGRFNTENIKKQEQLKTAEEIAKRKHTQDINIILILVSISILVGSWLVYRYLKLRQEKLKLEFVQSQLLQQNEFEKLQNDSREKILNATLDGKESERKMIAETLHHSVSSLLSSASLHLQASKMIMKGDQPEEIEKAHNIIKEAADKIRNLSHSLVSSVLLKFGLKYALQDLCEKYSNSAISFICVCDELERYDSDFELKINSIIDELLNNVIKHSNASKANIVLKAINKDLEITITDNGNGFDPLVQKGKSGLGIKQIEARINKMKGVFDIDSSKGEGTKIFISVPIQMKEVPNLN